MKRPERVTFAHCGRFISKHQLQKRVGELVLRGGQLERFFEIVAADWSIIGDETPICGRAFPSNGGNHAIISADAPDEIFRRGATLDSGTGSADGDVSQRVGQGLHQTGRRGDD